MWLSDGLRIGGLSAWIATIVIVWAVALAVGILLPWFLVRRSVARRRNAAPAAMTRRGR